MTAKAVSTSLKHLGSYERNQEVDKLIHIRRETKSSAVR